MIDDSQLDLWLTPAGWDDPYPFFQELRERDPVRHVPWVPFWTLFRHEDVEAALQDPRFSSTRPANSFPVTVPEGEAEQLRAIGDYMAEFMIWMDPPAHSRQRALVQKAFTARAIERFRPQVRDFARRRLATAGGADSFDWVGEIALPMPSNVVMELLGVPEDGFACVKSCADAVTEFLGVFGEAEPGRIRRLYERIEACGEYLLPLVAERRARPKDDLISSFAAAREGGEALSDREVVVLTIVMLFGGAETTTNLLGNGMMALLRHPEQLARLRDEPGRLPGAVEEMLRYDPPVQMVARFLTSDLELRGKALRRDDWALLVIGSANRDPARLADADRFDVTRPPSRHLSFGLGRHFCVGAMLARLEAHEVFAEALERFPRWELDPGRVRRRPNPSFRGFDELGVRFG